MYQQRFPLREVEHHRDQRHQSTGSERVVCEVVGGGEAHLEVTPVEREENTNDKKYSVDTPRHPAGLLGPDQSTLDLPRASKIIQERRFYLILLYRHYHLIQSIYIWLFSNKTQDRFLIKSLI